MQCTKCRSSELLFVRRAGSLETWRCSACSHELVMHVQYTATPAPVAPTGLGPVLNLLLSWDITPTMEQVAELRKMFPRLTNEYTAEQLLDKARRREQVIAGAFREPAIESFKGKLLELGVRASQQPL